MYQIMNSSLFYFKPSFHTETYNKSYDLEFCYCEMVLFNCMPQWRYSSKKIFIKDINNCRLLGYAVCNTHKKVQVVNDQEKAEPE